MTRVPWFPSQPVASPGLIVLVVGGVLFAAILIYARMRRGPRDPDGERRSLWSWLGILTQGLAITLVGVGPVVVTQPPLATLSIVAALAVGALMGGAVILFAWATRTMGANWSLVARTRSDHQLVQTGPFAHLRHPIYVAMALFMFALAVAYGHFLHLLLAVPIFARGTWLRVREEEALLSQAFGPAHDAYARRVRRFIPGMF